MFYRMKVAETIRKVVLIEAESDEAAHAKAKDGHGKPITFPAKEIYTEILNTEELHPENFRELQESKQPQLDNNPDLDDFPRT